ncbi:SGNH/GDSL hydrolase family protein [Bacillus haikouensis]|uniref:SGNH/GDSL hydrolase family protein n=1 Tax=Bacillus haikouensis TaxID=1510468 RepID=UPI001552F844|nr:SGNH/GDSL hydrolase family protein [Bacillus haikouensis]NQD65611.1 SGNH/GDSL hydrolase family protein [Bacillus haikouensis]
MKSFLITILAISCAAFLFLGNMYWKERTSISATSDTAGTETVNSEVAEDEKKEEEQVKDEVETESAQSEEDVDVQTLISNWPEDAQQRFISLLEEGEPFKMAVVGSNAMGLDENGWAPQLMEALGTNYGDHIDVQLFQYDLTSIDFINGAESDEVISFEPDLVLFEPFSLVDNSNSVGTVQNHESILMFENRLNEMNGKSVLLLQPPHPLAGATYYPEQIESLEEFAAEEGIPYIDHWTGWPEENELADYLIESQDTPNDRGHEIWADQLIDYFVSE